MRDEHYRRNGRNGKNGTRGRGLVVSSDTLKAGGKWAARVLNYSRVSQHASTPPICIVDRWIFSERNLSESWSRISRCLVARSIDQDSLDRYPSATNVRWRVLPSSPPPQQISVYIRYALETFRSRSMPRFFFEGDKWVGYAAYNNILLLARFLNSLFEEIGNILFLLLSVKRKQRIVSEKRMAVFEKSSVAHSSLVILYFYIIICFRFNGVPLQFIRRNSSYGNTLFLLLLYYYRIKPKQWIVFIWEENGRFFLGLMEVGDQ